MKRPELLSPAGDREKLEAALAYGADAVYLAGEEFGMRCASENFSQEAIADAIACFLHNILFLSDYINCFLSIFSSTYSIFSIKDSFSKVSNYV